MNELAVSIGVILFPGLIAAIICDKIASHSPKWRIFKYSVYSFVFGVICYALVELAANVLHSLGACFWSVQAPPPEPLHVWSIATKQKADINLSEVFLATLLAPFVAIAASVLNNYKVINTWAQKYGLSYKFGDENLFSYYLNRNDIRWVWIRDKVANLTYAGAVLSWSETDHIQEIVLEHVEVFQYSDSSPLYSLPSIYLARPTGTFVIEQGRELMEIDSGQKASE